MTENTEQYQNKCLNLWILQIDLNTLPVQLEMSAPKSEDDFSGCSKGGHMFTDLILFLLVEIHTPIKFTHQYLMACEDRFFNPMLKLSIQHFHIFFCIFFKHLYLLQMEIYQIKSLTLLCLHLSLYYCMSQRD